MIQGADWPQLGRDHTNNPVSREKNPPVIWKAPEVNRANGEVIKPGVNIKWSAPLGRYTFSPPVVSDGLIWIGTTSSRDYDKHSDRALKCFREKDGEFLWEYKSPKIGTDFRWDSYTSAIGCSPLIEGDRLWFTTNRCETICLDIGPLKTGKGLPKILWTVKMIEKLGVFPRSLMMGPVRTCSPAGWKDWIYVITCNGTNLKGEIPAPDAPSLVCFEKETGKVVWTDNSPGENILVGQWGSPLAAEIDAVFRQVIAPFGDGWIRSFHAETGKPLWQFDINFKTAASGGYFGYLSGTRNFFFNAPVLYDKKIYIASGMGIEAGAGDGRLVCIDPTKRGDISSELAVDADGKKLPHRRFQAVDVEQGERAIANSNSGMIWEFRTKPEGEWSADQMYRSTTQVAAHKGLVIAVDVDCCVHCLDAATGEHYWSCDMFSAFWSSPLIVDETVFVIDEESDVAIFPLTKEAQRAVKTNRSGEMFPRTEFYSNMEDGWGDTDPIFANGVLYVTGNFRLYAIEAPHK